MAQGGEAGSERFRRRIFYLGGYDPRGARYYHQLYAEQAALYARRSGHEIVVGERARDGKADSGWTIEDRTDGTTNRLTFLAWDDLVRRSWDTNPLRLLWGAVTATLSFTRRMDWRHTARFPPGSLIAFFYPSMSAVVLPILLIALIWLLAGPILAILIGVGVSWWVVHRLRSFWLLRFVIFNDRYARGRADSEIDRRLDAMADTIDAAFAEDWDEILFVTHSNGSILCVPVMARLLERHGGQLPAHFALMTLGSSIPLLGCRKDAHRYQAQLDTVAEGEFLWLDLGSLTDGACIALFDPCVSCASAHRPTLHSLSPRWFKYCDPATYQKRRRNKYETHFEYLRSFDRVSPLDYLRVTSCAVPLAASIAAFAQERE